MRTRRQIALFFGIRHANAIAGLLGSLVDKTVKHIEQAVHIRSVTQAAYSAVEHIEQTLEQLRAIYNVSAECYTCSIYDKFALEQMYTQQIILTAAHIVKRYRYYRIIY